LAPLVGSYRALTPCPAPEALHVTIVWPYYASKQSPLRLRYYPIHCCGLTAYISRTTGRTVAVVRAVAHAGYQESRKLVNTAQEKLDEYKQKLMDSEDDADKIHENLGDARDELEHWSRKLDGEAQNNANTVYRLVAAERELADIKIELDTALKRIAEPETAPSTEQDVAKAADHASTTRVKKELKELQQTFDELTADLTSESNAANSPTISAANVIISTASKCTPHITATIALASEPVVDWTTEKKEMEKKITNLTQLVEFKDSMLSRRDETIKIYEDEMDNAPQPTHKGCQEHISALEVFTEEVAKINKMVTAQRDAAWKQLRRSV
jgi:chromosome segregation ATPase